MFGIDKSVSRKLKAPVFFIIFRWQPLVVYIFTITAHPSKITYIYWNLLCLVIRIFRMKIKTIYRKYAIKLKCWQVFNLLSCFGFFCNFFCCISTNEFHVCIYVPGIHFVMIHLFKEFLNKAIKTQIERDQNSSGLAKFWINVLRINKRVIYFSRISDTKYHNAAPALLNWAVLLRFRTEGVFKYDTVLYSTLLCCYFIVNITYFFPGYQCGKLVPIYEVLAVFRFP